MKLRWLQVSGFLSAGEAGLRRNTQAAKLYLLTEGGQFCGRGCKKVIRPNGEKK